MQTHCQFCTRELYCGHDRNCPYWTSLPIKFDQSQEQAMPSISEKVSSVPSQPARTGPLWKGPHEDGITFSMLSRWLVCRERFRVAVIEGLRPVDQFNHKIEFGSMWHVCEEAHAAAVPSRRWQIDLDEYVRGLMRRYPTSVEQIDHWYNVIKVTFPLYVEFWKKCINVASRQPLMQEQVFNVAYTLPSGRVVRLRGKWDSVELTGTGKDAGIYLFETKTKGDIDEVKIKRQLIFDLQTLLYLVALSDGYGPVRGVRYNVIKRPLSGGKGSIVRHKGSKSTPPETKADFYQRVASYIRDDPSSYFMRWQVEVNSADVLRFRRECLDPILEQLCDWWEWVNTDNQPFQAKSMNIQGVDAPVWTHNAVHYRHPFGVWNPMDNGGETDLDSYIETGSEAGLTRIDNLFPELT